MKKQSGCACPAEMERRSPEILCTYLALGWCPHLPLPHLWFPGVLLLPATAALPNLESGSHPPGFKHYTETIGNHLSLGVTVERGLQDELPCAPPSAQTAARVCRARGSGNNAVPGSRGRGKLRGGGAGCGAGPQPCLSQSAARAQRACRVPALVPPPRPSWPWGCLQPAEHLESWRPAAAAVAERGCRASRPGSERRGAPGGPRPREQRGEQPPSY